MLRIVTLFSVPILFGVSLCLPAVTTNSEEPKPMPGWGTLLFGYFLILDCPAWLANVALFAAWIGTAARKLGFAASAGVVALVLASSTFMIYAPNAAPARRSGEWGPASGDYRITQLHAGFYCWYGCMAWTAAVSTIAFLAPPKRPAPPKPPPVLFPPAPRNGPTVR